MSLGKRTRFTSKAFRGEKCIIEMISETAALTIKSNHHLYPEMENWANFKVEIGDCWKNLFGQEKE